MNLEVELIEIVWEVEMDVSTDYKIGSSYK